MPPVVVSAAAMVIGRVMIAIMMAASTTGIVIAIVVAVASVPMAPAFAVIRAVARNPVVVAAAAPGLCRRHRAGDNDNADHDRDGQCLLLHLVAPSLLGCWSPTNIRRHGVTLHEA